MVWVCDLSAFVCGLLGAHFSHTHSLTPPSPLCSGLGTGAGLGWARLGGLRRRCDWTGHQLRCDFSRANLICHCPSVGDYSFFLWFQNINRTSGRPV